MPFNNNFGNPTFSSIYGRPNPLNNLQGNAPLDNVSQLNPQQQVGPGNVPPLNNRVNVPPINPGMASVGPSPAVLNNLMAQPLPNVQPQGPPLQRPNMPVGNTPPMAQQRRPMFGGPTANGRMGY